MTADLTPARLTYENTKYGGVPLILIPVEGGFAVGSAMAHRPFISFVATEALAEFLTRGHERAMAERAERDARVQWALSADTRLGDLSLDDLEI